MDERQTERVQIWMDENAMWNVSGPGVPLIVTSQIKLAAEAAVESMRHIRTPAPTEENNHA